MHNFICWTVSILFGINRLTNQYIFCFVPDKKYFLFYTISDIFYIIDIICTIFRIVFGILSFVQNVNTVIYQFIEKENIISLLKQLIKNIYQIKSDFNKYIPDWKFCTLGSWYFNVFIRIVFLLQYFNTYIYSKFIISIIQRRMYRIFCSFSVINFSIYIVSNITNLLIIMITISVL